MNNLSDTYDNENIDDGFDDLHLEGTTTILKIFKK